MKHISEVMAELLTHPLDGMDLGELDLTDDPSTED